MTYWKLFLTIFLISLFPFSTAPGEESNAAWKKVNESDGIIGYTRPTPKSSVDEIKATGTIDAPVAVIEAVLRDAPAQTQYMFMCCEAFDVNTQELATKDDIRYFYNKTDMPWPVDDRDFIGRGEFKIDKEKGILSIQAKNVSTSFKTEDKSVVRMPIAEGKWVLTPLAENKTEVLYQALADPGGKLPAFLVNMLTKDLGVKTIEGMRKMVKMDKYKNAKSIVTTTPLGM